MNFFPKSEHRILKLVYENPGIRLSELIKKARVSAATAKKRLDYLLGSGVISEEKITGGNRVVLKRFYPDLSSEEGKNVFSLVEAGKKHEFFRRNKALAGPFRQLLKNVNGTIKIVLVFGSFADYSQGRDSDLDILFLVSRELDKNVLKKEIERSFVTFDQEVSPRVESIADFRRNLDRTIYQTIVRNHIIVKGALDFIEMTG